MKRITKSLKIDERDELMLELLRERHIGKNDSDRFRRGLECLCDKNEIAVPA